MSGTAWKLDRKIDALLLIGGIVLALETVSRDWNAREMMALAAIVLMFAANIPYCISAVRGLSQPHVITWLLLAVITGLAFWKQIQTGAELKTSLPLLAAAIMNVVNSAFGWTHAKKHIRPSDFICLLVAALAICLWKTANDPLYVVICLTVASLAAYVPTVVKAYNDPRSEPLRTYQRNTVRYALITLAVNPYSVVTLMYPATWITVNGLFCVLLFTRIRQVTYV